MLSGVDILLHDAQFVESERTIADLFGHATIDEAIALATACEVGTLVLFHHGPARTDDQLDAIERELQARPNADAIAVRMAAQGDVLQLPSH
jgi:ribonuclease BN (tRNA processing enzyme)